METQELLEQYLEAEYCKLTVLGRGEENTTWLAQCRQNNKIVVFKQILPEEIEIYEQLKSCRHSGLVKIYNIYRLKNMGVVIEEYVSGNTIDELQREQRVFSEQEITNYMLQLVSVLKEIHGKGIIHRDITPKNVLISTDGVIKLIDFGISRRKKENQSRDTRILGTVGYASPEQYGFGQTDERADIYALGVLLNVMSVGKLPNEELTEKKPFRNIVLKCTQLEPTARYADVDMVRKDLLHEKKCSIIPGFRTDVVWKKIVASVWYVMFGIYSVAYPLTDIVGGVERFLEYIALILYIWIPFLILTNFGYIDKKVPVIRKAPKVIRVVLRIVVSFIIFYQGILLDNYVHYVLMGLPRP